LAPDNTSFFICPTAEARHRLWPMRLAPIPLGLAWSGGRSWGAGLDHAYGYTIRRRGMADRFPSRRPAIGPPVRPRCSPRPNRIWGPRRMETSPTTISGNAPLGDQGPAQVLNHRPPRVAKDPDQPRHGNANKADRRPALPWPFPRISRPSGPAPWPFMEKRKPKFSGK